MARKRETCTKVVQFSIGLDNTGGTLARLCARLRQAGVNIDAISVADNADCGWVRVVATPAAKARATLDRHGYLVCARQVIALRAENRPGELERVAKALAKAGVNIHYVYGSGDGESPMMILGVSDIERGMEVLGG